jgi:cbb3-type cytochrome oxidase subunit 3|tara:strand:+ start:933 stop:1064 length:132 start_codon:yes stop_codon:yes gene_type:complete
MNTAIVISAIVLVIYKLGKREINNIEKNIELYEQKEKAEQQKS